MNLPTGIVTFLFTDIEGSAALAQRFPAELPDLLARHHAILNAAIQAHNGYVFQIIGDAFSAAFFTPWDALNAATMAQRQLQRENWGGATMRVRMGIHTGAAQAGVIEEKAGGYVGYLTLTRTQRVMSAAYGEQVLISHSSAQLVRPELPPSVTLRDMGEHALKGLTEPERLWQPVAPELRTDFPPLKTANAAINTLPANLTPLIGREAELAQVQTLLSQPANRLITLTGMGGMGKTHFAQVVAAHVAPSFADGVMYVPLAPVRDADLVIPTIARAFGLQDSGGGDGLDVLIKHLRDKALLLLLDNFEQVIEAGHELTRLLQMTSQIKIIITSRVALRVAGEQTFALSPLAGAWAQDLFLARAQAVVGVVDYAAQAAAHADAISAICKRLEGIPLAIELAASQLQFLSAKEILLRLDFPLKNLTARNPNTRKRENVLQIMLDRSYELLNDFEQRIFRRMGAFIGGATLFDIGMVCAIEDDRLSYDEDAVEDAIWRLIETHMLRHTPGLDAGSRYSMHELIREYALVQMHHHNEGQIVGHRHATHFCSLLEITQGIINVNNHRDTGEFEDLTLTYGEKVKSIEKIWKSDFSPDFENRRFRPWLEQNIGNLQAAIDWSHLSTVDPKIGANIEVRIVGGASSLLYVMGYTKQCDAMLARALPRRHLAPPFQHMLLLFTPVRKLFYSQMSLTLAEIAEIRQLSAEGCQIAEQIGNQPQYAMLHLGLGIASFKLGDIENAIKYGEIGFDAANMAHYIEGIIALGVYKLQLAEFNKSWTHMLPLAEMCMGHARNTIFFFISRVCFIYARLLMEVGQYAQSREIIIEGLDTCKRNKGVIDIPMGLVTLALYCLKHDRLEEATTLTSAAYYSRKQYGAYLGTSESLFDQTVAIIQSGLHVSRLQMAWEIGQMLSPLDAADEALRLLEKR